MRAVFGMLSLVVVLAAVGLLVKKQLGGSYLAIPALASPTSTTSTTSPTSPDGRASTVVDPTATVKAQSQHIQLQYKQALDSALQTPRALDDAEKP